MTTRAMDEETGRRLKRRSFVFRDKECKFDRFAPVAQSDRALASEAKG